MEMIISRGEVSSKFFYPDHELKEMLTALVIILLGRDKFISPKSAQAKLKTIEEMISDFLSETQDKNKKKEWSLLKRKLTNYQKIFSNLKKDVSIQIVIWDFISSLDGNPNLSGFGLCQMPFKDKLVGNAEKISLYKLGKFKT